MAFAKASTNKEDVKQAGGSKYINGSGIYPVTVLAPIVSVSRNGSTTIDMFVEHEGQKQILYGNLRITNNDGSENQIGSRIFNQLMIVAGVEEVADPVEEALPIGKDGALKDVAVLQDLADVDVMMRVQMEYSKYNGNIVEKKIIKTFFRAADNATAEEIVNEAGYGEGFEKEQKYVNNVTYKDDLTEADITAWIAANRPKGTAGGSSAPAKAPAFGNKPKRFGAKANEE